MAASSDRKRLHTTPFNATLLDRFIPPSLQSQATNISYHTVETFPDRGFGYVELPVMEADKLKKKFNGSTLKGTKAKIEDAKPEKKMKRKAEAEDDSEKKERKRMKKEKRKKEDGVVPGHELEEGRHVKRGWSDGTDGQKHKKSKNDGKPKESREGKNMLFKTVVPRNAVPVDKEKKAKSKDGEEKKESKGKKKTVVQEFAKAHKPNAANAISKHGKAAVFDEEKGWQDEDGNVVEAAPVSKKPKKQAAQPAPPVVKAPVDAESSGSDDEDAESSVVSSDSDEEEETHQLPAPDTPMQDITEVTQPTSVELIQEVEGAAKEVHPLEAHFKRPAPKPDNTSRPSSATKPKPSPIDTSFNFFSSGSGAPAEDEDMDAEPDAVAYPPQTPHTKQDLEWRSIRSAAPTPDTAAIGRKFSFPFAAGVDEEDEENDAEEPVEDAVAAKSGAQNGEKEESEFRKWFYETRGEHNRDWKKKRREGRKALRQRENRRLSRRVV